MTSYISASKSNNLLKHLGRNSRGFAMSFPLCTVKCVESYARLRHSISTSPRTLHVGVRTRPGFINSSAISTAEWYFRKKERPDGSSGLEEVQSFNHTETRLAIEKTTSEKRSEGIYCSLLRPRSFSEKESLHVIGRLHISDGTNQRLNRPEAGRRDPVSVPREGLH